MAPRTALISGLGVAGPALAYWLLRRGWQPTLIERAAEPRQGGYIIDVWGMGYELLERMGLIEPVLAAGYQLREVRLVDRLGHRVGGFDADVFRRATRGRFTSVPRGALSAVLSGAIAERAEVSFGNAITALEDQNDAVVVGFEHGPSRRFDLVVGADGLHSGVRRLGFGHESIYEKFLGYTVAAFSSAGYRPRDEGAYVTHAVPGRTMSRFSLRDDRTLFLLLMNDPQAPRLDALEPAAQRAYLRQQFANVAWERPRILAALEHCDDLYLDRVSQIRMERWCKGRVALLGDAAFAPSLLAGQGSALAIIAAYVLAGELGAAQSVASALERYQTLLQGFLARKQRAAVRFARSFVPQSERAISLRNLLTHLFKLPLVARLAIGPTLVDPIQLPRYD